MTDARPEIASFDSSAELKRWYWRKAELVAEARRLGLKTSGAKFTILDRIGHFHDTGEPDFPGDQRAGATSKFNWHSAPLTPETEITDNYKNSQNVRRFFKQAIGADFKFHTAFMDWMRRNTGKTLADACEAYRDLQAAKKAPGYLSAIREHNQFNQYTRDFLDDNPGLSMNDVRKAWAKKINRPSDDGRHRYERSDLELGDP